jgi:hypothetical protein
MGRVSTNDEIEDGLEKLLKKISDPGHQPDGELTGRCTRYISLCFQTNNLSRNAIETIEIILDMMEIRLKSSHRA